MMKKFICKQIGLLGLLLLFMLPFTGVVHQLLLEINSRIEFTQKEIQGDAYLRPLEKLLKDIPQQRRLTHHYLIQGTNRENLISNQYQIDQDLKELENVQAKLGKNLRITNKFQVLKENWQSIKQKAFNLKPISTNDDLNIEILHKQLIADIRTLISYVGDNSNLILDPDLDSYYLMDSVLLQLPNYQDLLAQLILFSENVVNKKALTTEERGKLIVLSGLLKANLEATKTGINTITTEEKGNFIVLSGLLQANLEATKKGMKVAFNNNPAQTLKPSLDNPLQEYITAGETFLAKLDRELIQAQTIDVQPEEYNLSATKALDASFNFWNLAVNQLDNLLEARLDKFARKKHFVEAFSGLVLILAIYVFIVSSRNLDKRQRAIDSRKTSAIDTPRFSASALILAYSFSFNLISNLNVLVIDIPVSFPYNKYNTQV